MCANGKHGKFWLWIGLVLAVVPLGGCGFSCKAETDGSLREVVDEIGDEVEDVIDKVDDALDD